MINIKHLQIIRGWLEFYQDSEAKFEELLALDTAPNIIPYNTNSILTQALYHARRDIKRNVVMIFYIDNTEPPNEDGIYKIRNMYLIAKKPVDTPAALGYK